MQDGFPACVYVAAGPAAESEALQDTAVAAPQRVCPLPISHRLDPVARNGYGLALRNLIRQRHRPIGGITLSSSVAPWEAGRGPLSWLLVREMGQFDLIGIYEAPDDAIAALTG